MNCWCFWEELIFCRTINEILKATCKLILIDNNILTTVLFVFGRSSHFDLCSLWFYNDSILLSSHVLIQFYQFEAVVSFLTARKVFQLSIEAVFPMKLCAYLHSTNILYVCNQLFYLNQDQTRFYSSIFFLKLREI